MSFYLGHPNNGNRTVAPALTARGIDLLRAVPSEINVDIFIEIKQVAFPSYVSNLPAFMMATATRAVVKIPGVTGFPVASLSPEQCFPLRLPPLVVDFTKRPNEAQLAILAGIGYEEITIQNNKQQMIFQHYNLEQARQISSMSANPVTRCTIDTINLDALRGLTLIRRIMSSFFRTHIYPAFSEDEAIIPFDDFKEVYDIDNKQKRKRSDDDVGGGRDHEGNPLTEERSGENEEAEETRPLSPLDRVTLFRAKPSRIEENYWGDVNTIPSLPGILCPYVSQLASNDKTGVPALVQRYFFSSLGSTFADQSANFDKLKTAWGNICSTAAGDVLSHLAFMIDIGLQCQARPYAIFDGTEYMGTVLSGCRFKIRSRSTLYSPIAHADILVKMGDAKFHSAVLTAIANMAGEHGAAVRACKTMRQLSTVLLGAAMTEDIKDNIRKEAVHLNFGERAWAMNATSLLKLLDLLRDSGVPIDNGVPMHHTSLFNNDRVASALSAFGYQAPTFLIPSCPQLALKSGSDAPKTFVFRAVSLESAVSDWRVVLGSKAITNNPANLSKNHKDRSLSGGEKKNVWMRLTQCVNAQAAANGAKGDEEPVGGNVVGGGDDVFSF